MLHDCLRVNAIARTLRGLKEKNRLKIIRKIALVQPRSFWPLASSDNNPHHYALVGNLTFKLVVHRTFGFGRTVRFGRIKFPYFRPNRICNVLHCYWRGKKLVLGFTYRVKHPVAAQYEWCIGIFTNTSRVIHRIFTRVRGTSVEIQCFTSD